MWRSSLYPQGFPQFWGKRCLGRSVSFASFEFQVSSFKSTRGLQFLWRLFLSFGAPTRDRPYVVIASATAARGIPTLRIALALLIPDDNRVEQGIQTCALFILSTFVIPSSDEESAPLLRHESHDLALTYPQRDRN